MAKRFVVLAAGMLMCFFLNVVAFGSEEIQGNLETIFSENRETHECKPSYFLRDNTGKKIRMLIKERGGPSGLPPNSRITAIGDFTEHGFNCEKVVPNVPRLMSKAEVNFSNTTGEQKTLIILVTFSDFTEEEKGGATNDDAEKDFFDALNPYSVDNFYRENSENKTWFTGQCLGEWYVLPNEATYYGYGSWNYSDIKSREILADAVEAADPDVYFPDYSRVVIVMAGKWLYAFATLGKIVIETDDGPVTASVSWLDHRDILQIKYYYDLHEMGHNFTNMHAGGVYYDDDCFVPEKIKDKYRTTNEQHPYEISQYEDTYSVMGESGSPFPTIIKNRMGWLADDQIVTINNGSDVWIAQRVIASEGIKCVKFPFGISTAGNLKCYFLEYSFPIGSDSDRNFDKVLLRFYTENELWVEDDDTVIIQSAESMPIADGFCDTTGVNIEVLEKSGEGADAKVKVRVTFEPPQDGSPQMAALPDEFYVNGGYTDNFQTEIVLYNPHPDNRQYLLTSDKWDVVFLNDKSKQVNSVLVEPRSAVKLTAVVYPELIDGNYDLKIMATDTSNSNFYTEVTLSVMIEGSPKITPTPSPTPSPTPTAKPSPTPPPKPTPTPSPTPSPTPTPTPMTVKEIQLSPESLKVKKGQEIEEIVTLVCDEGKKVSGAMVTVTVIKGKRKVSVSPAGATSDKNGQAVFKITGKKSGKAQVVFSSQEVNKSLRIKIK